MKIGILGASGNVGRLIVRRLLSYGTDVVERVVLVNRRVIGSGVLPQGGARLVQHIADMSSADAFERACAPLLESIDVVISTMGVGSGKGAAELFRKVEVELPSAFARAAKSSGVARAVLLTGVGANISSRSSWLVGGAAGGKFFYFKGLVEKNFTDAGFAGGLAIFRPAGLLGTSHAPAFLDWLLPKIDWIVPVRFRCIHIQQLASAMAGVAVDPAKIGPGVTSFEGERLFGLLSGRRWRGDLGVGTSALANPVP